MTERAQDREAGVEDAAAQRRRRARRTVWVGASVLAVCLLLALTPIVLGAKLGRFIFAPAFVGGVLGIELHDARGVGLVEGRLTRKAGIMVVKSDERWALVEGLEERALLAEAFAHVSAHGTLVVVGTSGADMIEVSSPDASHIVAKRNGSSLSFDASKILRISIDAGAGNDSVKVTASRRSTILGGDGNDKLTGGPLKDSLNGGPGNDTLNGKGGNDSLTGGDGDDVAEYGDRGAGFIFDFPAFGRDGIFSNSYDPADIGSARSGNEADVIRDGFERIGGTQHSDSFWTGPYFLPFEFPGSSDAVLDGRGGDDNYFAYEAESGGIFATFMGGAGNDSMGYDLNGLGIFYGGEGDDTIVFTDTASTFFDGGPGIDKIFGSSILFSEGAGSDTYTLDLNHYPNVEDAEADGPYKLIGTSGPNHLTLGVQGIYADGGGGDDVLDASESYGFGTITLLGGGGNDTLIGSNMITDVPDSLDGGAGNDRLEGGRSDDTLRGGDGNDTLDGAGGADFISGGAGNDTVTYSSRTKNVVIGIGVVADDGEAGEHDNVYKDVETVIGGSGNDVIRGSSANNVLIGGGGNDTLIGGGGRDALFGQAGNDSLLGGDANDFLDGGDGNDTLVGGAGNDTLNGWGGDDLLLAKDGARDTVNGGAGLDRARVDNSSSVKDLWSEIETLLA